MQTQMKIPIIEMDGDEMTRILWDSVKEKLILPFVDLKTEYFDLGVQERDRTNNEVSVRAAEALMEHGVGVKCPTITPTPERVKEYGLANDVVSPNRIVRSKMGGMLFRMPICIPAIDPLVPNWKSPITIVRYVYGDVYRGVEMLADKGDVCEIVLRKANGDVLSKNVHEFCETGGMVQAVHNTDAGIEAFARCAMGFAVEMKQDLWFGAKDTVSKVYDRRFFEIFDEVYHSEFVVRFESEGIAYHRMLIDDAVSRALRSGGGFVWACKSYDGDVFSDMVATGFGSIAMMSSSVVSPSGQVLYEAAHGTVQQHYYRHMRGESVSTNPIGLIYAWSGALRKRGQLDGLGGLCGFADALERAVAETVEDGVMTADLFQRSVSENKREASSFDFILEVAERLARRAIL